jgi:hypothetical protein
MALLRKFVYVLTGFFAVWGLTQPTMLLWSVSNRSVVIFSVILCGGFFCLGWFAGNAGKIRG